MITMSRFFTTTSTLSGVVSMDLDFRWTYYANILDDFPGQDHYFILDRKLNVIHHSKTSFMLKKASITQIEFGVTETQQNKTHDNVPDAEVYTEESEYFNQTILPAFLVDDI